MPHPHSPSPTTHVKVIVIVVPIVGVVCLGLLAALLCVLFIRRRRSCPDVAEEEVEEVEDVKVKVTEHVRIVEGVVGEVEAYKAGDAGCGCGDGGVVEEAGIVVRFTEASKRERE